MAKWTPAQAAALKAHIAANAAVIPAGQPFAGTAVKDIPNGSDGNATVAWWYNQIASPSYLVWNEAASRPLLRAAVSVGNYTPADAVPASGSTVQISNDQLVYQNRALVCQLKQANAFFLTQNEGTVDATPSALRLSFNDCMANIPAGASGANVNAGWGTPAAPGAVRLAMQRTALNIEKVFSVQAAGTGTAGNVSGDARGGTTNPDALVVVGTVTGDNIEEARNS